MLIMSAYNPERYWSSVAEEIKKRGENYLAGDDNPFYRYKRKQLLRQFLDRLDVQNKTILELGVGPGGNLLHIATHQKPTRIFGVDISEAMLDIARCNLRNYSSIVELRKITGTTMPFQDRSMDVAITVTVLQHNTDDNVFRSLVGELCRVTSGEVIIMEDVGDMERPCEDGSWIARSVDVYKEAFMRCGYRMVSVDVLRLRLTEWWYNKVYSRIHSGLSHKAYKEGQAISVPFRLLIGIPILATQYLDEYFPLLRNAETRGLAKMVFRHA
jgi:ubiquinone/menaquinone biosynthesis C-methylase UbiE